MKNIRDHQLGCLIGSKQLWQRNEVGHLAKTVRMTVLMSENQVQENVQPWGCGEQGLQHLEGFHCLRNPIKRQLDVGESCEWGSRQTVIQNKLSVEMSRAQEPLQLLPGTRDRLGGCGRNLVEIHLTGPLCSAERTQR